MMRRLQFLATLSAHGRAPAVLYAQKHLAPFAATHMTDIKRLMGCLLFAGNLEKSPYTDLVSPHRW
jgi:E3 ubiquitin-protein transferase RMND5